MKRLRTGSVVIKKLYSAVIIILLFTKQNKNVKFKTKCGINTITKNNFLILLGCLNNYYEYLSN